MRTSTNLDSKKALATALLLTALMFTALLPAARAHAATKTAEIVFFGKKVSSEPVQIWGARADGSESFPIHSAEPPEKNVGQINSLALSPNGQSVAVTWSNSVGVISVETGKLTTVWSASNAQSTHAGPVEWSPDGVHLVFVGDITEATKYRGHLYTVNKSGAELKLLTPALPEPDQRYEWPSYSPNGKSLVFLTSSEQTQYGKIMTCATDGTGSRVIYGDPESYTSLQAPKFSPDGTQIYFVAGGLPNREQAIKRISATGGSVYQLTRENRDLGGNYYPTWLPDSNKIVWLNNDYRHNITRLKIMDSGGENAEPFLPSFAATGEASFRQPKIAETTEANTLLSKYSPVLRLDSQEEYGPDSSAEIVDNWGDQAAGLHKSGKEPYTNVLWDADGTEVSGTGTEIARSGPSLKSGQFRLTLSSLGAKYPSGATADANDWIDERNDHTVEDTERLEAAGYGNRVYGHAVRDVNGTLWLQYWVFYYYDNLSYAGVGEHEGDWEMYQVALSKTNEPTEYILSQHKRAVRCLPNELTFALYSPVLYPGLGSHAILPAPGTYETETTTLTGQYDQNEGEREPVKPVVEIINDGKPSWVDWPGHWGNSRGGGFDQASPQGPELHHQWANPSAFATTASSCYAYKHQVAAKGPTPQGVGQEGPQIIRASAVQGSVQIEYTLPTGGGERELLLSVTSKADEHVHTVPIPNPPLRGTASVTVPLLSAGQPLVVLASTVEADGTRSPVVEAAVE